MYEDYESRSRKASNVGDIVGAKVFGSVSVMSVSYFKKSEVD